MAKPLKNFTLEKVIAATSPAVLQQYLHQRRLCLEIEDFKALRNGKKANEYSRYIAQHILETSECAQETIPDLQRVYILSKNQVFPHLINRIRQWHHITAPIGLGIH